jgi:dipeptidyl aminopeptidase/acylaminoacyl peptidase
MEQITSSLISRNTLFSNTFKKDVQISASGKFISYVTGVNGNMTVWVANSGGTENAEKICEINEPGFSGYSWVNTDDHLICSCAKYPDSFIELIKIDVVRKNTIKLTFENIKLRTLPGRFTCAGKIPVMGYRNSNEFGNLYILDSSKNELELFYENKEQFDWFICDNEFNLKYAIKRSTQENSECYILNSDGTWEKFPFKTIDPWQVVGCFKGRDSIFLIDTCDKTTNSLYELNIKSGERACIVSHPKADFDEHVIIEPTSGKVLAAGVFYIQMIWYLLDNEIEGDFAKLREINKGNLKIVSRSSNNNLWLVEYFGGDAMPEYLLYNRASKAVRSLFPQDLDREKIRCYPMNFSIVNSRDKLELVSYYTLPEGETPQKPLPTILLVHSGPWNRDYWGYEPLHQWLANRGYAVICVNFRGSTGFGNSFMEAGMRQWGRAMHNDLIDTIDHFVAMGVSDPQKIGIMGFSYGGYASLMALALNSDRFACGASFGGPLNLITLLNSTPGYSHRLLAISKKYIGETSSSEERKQLLERSPLYKVKGIRKPLLIGFGENDFQISNDECAEFIKSLQERDIPATQVRFADEGHDVRNNFNKCAFLAITESFFAHHLGGMAEEIGNDFDNTTISIPYGENKIPGLQKAFDEHTISQYEKYVLDLE